MTSGHARSVCAVICAAGRGTRAGFSRNKLLVPFRESTALEQSVAAFDFPLIDEILVVVSREDEAQVQALCARFPRTRTVPGGDTRSRSVYNALLVTRCDIVLIHDGARPFVSRGIIERCAESAERYRSGVCAVPAVDTVALSDERGCISSVPARGRVFALQTPQGFYTADLRAAYEKAFACGGTYTDDSSVYAQFVAPPRLCEGARDNIKLTYAEDFSATAARAASSPASPPARAGLGIDTHAFGKNQNYILLAGVKIPSESGLVAHSDGDVLAHAVMDAMLSAAGLKDIGHYFPDTDEAWAGADSMKMLARVKALIAAEGWAVQNLSVAVQAQKPRLARYIDGIVSALASALDLPNDAVGVSAGTNEGLGDIGEGKGICVRAIVLLRPLR